jgi:hypothetical protein
MEAARQIVHWRGKDTPMCDHHLLMAIKLAATMGFPLSWTTCEDCEETCKNCENEEIARLKKAAQV